MRKLHVSVALLATLVAACAGQESAHITADQAVPEATRYNVDPEQNGLAIDGEAGQDPLLTKDSMCEDQLPLSASAQPQGHQGNIREYAWKSHVFRDVMLGTVALKDGEFSCAPKEFPDSQVWAGLGQMAFGDIDGDGKEEALMLYRVNTGGSGYFSSVGVWTQQHDKMVLVAEIPGGDRGHGGLKSINVVDGQVEVTRFWSNEDDGACCPSELRVESWRFDGKNMVEDEAAAKVVKNADK